MGEVVAMGTALGRCPPAIRALNPSLPIMLLYCSKLVLEGYGMPRECAGVSF